MARRARFGQTPRVQPSLTSTLVSIAREMVAREDSNIMDAWQHGGEFEGKKVTDKMVLAYWKQREEGLDHSDPVFDTMQNQIEQLQYGIQQSEMDLKHVQGKISDSQFAQFYLKWAKKAPRQSEWWRSLQKDAAQLMQDAKAKSRQSADSAKAEAFNKFQTDQYKTNIGVGNALADAMDRMAATTGFSTTDHGEYLLSLVTDAYHAHPEEYQALAQALKDGDPNFSGTFDMTYYANAMNKATTGYGNIATRANKDGYADNFATAARKEADLAAHATDVKAWPVAKSYDQAFNKMQAVLADPHSSEMDKEAARSKFAVVAANLAKTPGLEETAKVALTNDALRASGQATTGDGESFGPSFLGKSHPGITQEDGDQQALFLARKQMMVDHPEMFTYASIDKDGNFDPTGQGAVGIVARANVPADAVFIPAPGLDGTPHMVAVKPHTVYMSDPNSPPKAGADAAGTPVGRTATLYIGGTSVTLYATGGGDGVERWSTSSPFADNLSTTRDKNGNLQLSANVTPPTDAERAASVYAQAKTLDTKYGTTMADSLVTKDAAGNVTGFAENLSGASFASKMGSAETGVFGGTTIKFDPDKGFTVTSSNSAKTGGEGGGLFNTASGSVTTTVPLAPTGQTFNPAQLFRAALDPSRFTAGDVPGVTFDSVAAAAASTFSSLLSGNQLRAVINDPEFQHTFIMQANATLGVTDPTTDLRGQQAWDTFKGKVSADADKSFYDTFNRFADATKNGLFGFNAKNRTDLTYPGQREGDGRSGVPGLTFSGQDIKVPTIPNMAAGGRGGVAPSAAGAQPNFHDQTLKPGQVPGQPAGYTPPSSFTQTNSGASKPSTTPTSTPGAGPGKGGALPGQTPGVGAPPPGAKHSGAQEF